MAVGSNNARTIHQADGVTKSFDVRFPFLDAAELHVSLFDPVNDERLDQALFLQFQAKGGDGAEGTITFNDAPASAYQVHIRRSMTFLQLRAFANIGSGLSRNLELAFDSLTMTDQQLRLWAQQSVRVAETDSIIPPLPSASARAGTLLYFDTDELASPIALPVDKLPGLDEAVQGAQASAANAAASEANALTYASGAATSEANALTHATGASASQAAAAGSAVTAETWSDKAMDWAVEAEDVEVSPGQYSAFHWAQKAQDVVGLAWGTITGTLSDQTDLQTALDAKADVSVTLVDGDFSGAVGAMIKTGSGTYDTLKHNLAATAAPGAADDSASGYSVGSQWADTTNDEAYVALDVAVGAAVWKRTTVTPGGSPTWGGIVGTLADQTDLQAALDAKAADSAVVKVTGAQTVNGVKTFGDIPVLPAIDPTGGDQATRKAWVDSQLDLKANAASTVFVATSQVVTGRKECQTNIFGSGDMATATGGLGELAMVSGDTGGGQGCATLAFERDGVYGVYFGLNTDNKLSVGGWSLGAVAYEVWHAGTFDPATKADDSAVVKLSGAQSVSGVKTFTSIPELPAASPTTDNQATRKKWVDDQLAVKADLVNVVTLSGAQMISGAKTHSVHLTLPTSNPTASGHAVSKTYMESQLANLNASNLTSGSVPSARLTSVPANNLDSGTVPSARGVTAGSTAGSFVQYTGTTRTGGAFYGGTTSPTGVTRLNYDGDLYVRTLVATSSREFKTGIEPLSTEWCLDAVLSLKPRAFTWRDSGLRDQGFIQDEVAGVLPHLAPEGGVSYDRLVTQLAGAIQEQQRLIRALRERVERLECRVGPAGAAP